jgi:hypothetical protein
MNGKSICENFSKGNFGKKNAEQANGILSKKKNKKMQKKLAT